MCVQFLILSTSTVRELSSSSQSSIVLLSSCCPFSLSFQRRLLIHVVFISIPSNEPFSRSSVYKALLSHLYSLLYSLCSLCYQSTFFLCTLFFFLVMSFWFCFIFLHFLSRSFHELCLYSVILWPTSLPAASNACVILCMNNYIENTLTYAQ